MNLTRDVGIVTPDDEHLRTKEGIMYIRKTILRAASALALASPVVAADLPARPYSNAPSYQRETHTY
jgi:hypothetical protein